MHRYVMMPEPSPIRRHGTKRPRVLVFEGFEMLTFAGCLKDALPLLERLSLRIEDKSRALEKWASLAVEYGEGTVPRSTAVDSNDDALSDVAVGPTGTVCYA